MREIGEYGELGARLTFMNDSFEELKALYKSGAALRHIAARMVADTEADSPAAAGDNLQEPSVPPDEVLLSPKPDSDPAGINSMPADVPTSEVEADSCLDLDLSPIDMKKIIEAGVRPKAAIEAGLRHV